MNSLLIPVNTTWRWSENVETEFVVACPGRHLRTEQLQALSRVSTLTWYVLQLLASFSWFVPDTLPGTRTAVPSWPMGPFPGPASFLEDSSPTQSPQRILQWPQAGSSLCPANRPCHSPSLWHLHCTHEAEGVSSSAQALGPKLSPLPTLCVSFKHFLGFPLHAVWQL